jgi:hypothetical protein
MQAASLLGQCRLAARRPVTGSRSGNSSPMVVAGHRAVASRVQCAPQQALPGQLAAAGLSPLVRRQAASERHRCLLCCWLQLLSCITPTPPLQVRGLRPSAAAARAVSRRRPPEPEGPSRAVIVPGDMSTSAPFTALNRPRLVSKCLTMPRTATSAPRTLGRPMSEAGAAPPCAAAPAPAAAAAAGAAPAAAPLPEVEGSGPLPLACCCCCCWSTGCCGAAKAAEEASAAASAAPPRLC